MNKTLEQFVVDTEFKNLSEKEIEYVKNTMFSNIYSFEKVIELLKQVRLATIKECAMKATWSYNGPEEYLYSYADDITINRAELLNLDLNTIEL